MSDTSDTDTLPFNPSTLTEALDYLSKPLPPPKPPPMHVIVMSEENKALYRDALDAAVMEGVDYYTAHMWAMAVIFEASR